MDDGYMTDAERATLARIALAVEDARDALERALSGVKVGDGPEGAIGQAVDALLALDYVTRACHNAWATHNALAAVE
jgi:hypothetical protein